MSRRFQENLFAGVILAVFIGVIVLSQDFGPRARMIPLPLAIFGVVLTVVQIIWQNVRSTDELQVDLFTVGGRPPGGAGSAGAASRASVNGPLWHKEAVACAMVAGLLALVLLVGPVPAIFVFTGGYFLVTRQYSWPASLIYTVVFTLVVYALFFLALQVQPYHGLLAPLVARFE